MQPTTHWRNAYAPLLILVPWKRHFDWNKLYFYELRLQHDRVHINESLRAVKEIIARRIFASVSNECGKCKRLQTVIVYASFFRLPFEFLFRLIFCLFEGYFFFLSFRKGSARSRNGRTIICLYKITRMKTDVLTYEDDPFSSRKNTQNYTVTREIRSYRADKFYSIFFIYCVFYKNCDKWYLKKL